MRRNIRVKPSRSQSLLGLVVGIVFIGIGLFIAIPTFGLFGFFWTLVAVFITVSNGINAFGEKGIATHEIEISEDEISRPRPMEVDFDEKLRKLKGLKDDGIISIDEYEKKKNDILNEKW